jgi:hypothetical protein
MTVRKRFDRELFNENDSKARQAINDLLAGSEYRVEDNIKKMGIDLFLYKGDQHIGYIECECKKVWSGQFKYDTLQIPERKRKYTGLDKKSFFVVFNKDFNECMIVKDIDLLASEVKIVPNKYVYAGEPFFQIPVSKVVMNDLINVIKNGEST